jgi:hypothetical protein
LAETPFPNPTHVRASLVMKGKTIVPFGIDQLLEGRTTAAAV